jgi:hypothetical protein
VIQMTFINKKYLAIFFSFFTFFKNFLKTSLFIERCKISCTILRHLCKCDKSLSPTPSSVLGDYLHGLGFDF